MFNRSYQTFPMGFQSPLSEGVKSQTEPDVEIVRLFNEYKTGTRSINSFDFRKEVIVAVKRLFGYLPEWLDSQDTNTKISQSAYDMLVDTIEMINTGRRDVPLAVRLSIIGTEQSTNTYLNPEAVGRTTKLRELLKIEPDEVIFRWITCDSDGFYDMLCTAHAIFGLTPRK